MEFSTNYSNGSKQQPKENRDPTPLPVVGDDISQTGDILTNTKPKPKISYKPTKADYSFKRRRHVQDTTRNIPIKQIAYWPKSWMGGILGLTVLGWDWMAIRDDQTDDEFQYVDTHECIHTNDEYETRIITDWMLSDKKRDNYIR